MTERVRRTKTPATATPPVDSKVVSTANAGPLLSLEDCLTNMQGDAYLRSRGVDPRGAFQLDLWPNDMRAIPNDFARAALFTSALQNRLASRSTE